MVVNGGKRGMAIEATARLLGYKIREVNWVSLAKITFQAIEPSGDVILVAGHKIGLKHPIVVRHMEENYGVKFSM